MTAAPEVRFVCNRCGDHTIAPFGNTPVHARLAPPDGWMTLLVGTDPGNSPYHLCPPCAFGLNAYLADNTLIVGNRKDVT